MNQATTGKGATEPLTGSGWQMSLSGLNLPSFAHRRGKGKISSIKQAKGGRTPDTLSGVGGEGSVSAAPTPFFLGKAMGGLALSQTGSSKGYLCRVQWGSSLGMIPHWEPRAKSIQYILIKFFRGSGQRGGTWGLTAGINNPYSNTPPQTTWFPNSQTRQLRCQTGVDVNR